MERDTQKNLRAGANLLAKGQQQSNPVDTAMAESASPMLPSVSAPSSGLQVPQLNLQGLLAQLQGGVSGAAAPQGGGNWSGRLGAVPQHHGWAGMQQGAKEWSLRLLGAFPQLSFSSGFRTPEANAKANGAPNSGHMRGWKSDFSGPSKYLHEAAAWAQNQGARILLHDAGSGYHLDVSWEGVPF